LTTFATPSGLPEQTLTPPPLPDACDACPPIVTPPVLWEAQDVLAPRLGSALPSIESDDASGESWLKNELALI
jgi:hypothetical protein